MCRALTPEIQFVTPARAIRHPCRAALAPCP